MIVRDLVVTPSPSRYAAEAEWFRTNQPITLAGKRYVKYGRPRPIDPAELSRIGLLGRVVIYAERGKSPALNILYVPVDASSFQPYETSVALPCS